MTCQKCQSSEATIHVTDRTPSGSFEGAHYCDACGRDLVPRFPPPGYRFVNVPSREQLATALREAAAMAGKSVTPLEALEKAEAFLKMIQERRSGGRAAE